MSETPTDRETVERIIAKQPMLTSLPPQENDVAKTLRALCAERDHYKTRAERAMERLEKLSRWLDLDDEELANLPIETLLEDHRHIQKQVNAALAELEGTER